MHSARVDDTLWDAAKVKAAANGITNMSDLIRELLTQYVNASDGVSIKEAIIDLLAGIDKEDGEDERGWWETSGGARFGAAVLAKIRDL